MTTKLSFDKFVKSLNDKGFSVVSLYKSKGKLVFLEARTPKTQKSFIIHIPRNKYVMKCKNANYKSFDITKIDLEVAAKNIEYISDVKGAILTCDIISISSEMMCLQKNSQKVYVYDFGKDKFFDEEVNEDEKEMSPIDKLIRENEMLTNMIKSDDEEAVEDDVEEDVDDDVDDEEDVEIDGEDIEAGDDEIDIEVDEADDEDEAKDDVEDDVDEEMIVIGGGDEEAENEKIELEFVEDAPAKKRKSKSKKTDVATTAPLYDKEIYSNAIPPTIEDEEISMGILYISIDLNELYKEIKEPLKFENEILSKYDILDDNQNELREIKIDEISEMANKIVKKAKDYSEMQKIKEGELKSQIIKLTGITDNLETLKTKMAKNEKRYLSAKPEVERVYNQTKNTIHEANIEIVKNRELTNEVLDIICSSLEDIYDP